MQDQSRLWADNPAYQTRIKQLLPSFQNVAAKYNLPPEAIPYMLANAGIESRFDTSVRDGASKDIGLLQITPVLAKDYKAQHTRDPATQIDVLGQYYQRMLKRGASLQTAALGWNTGGGRALQVQRGQRSVNSITAIAPKYLKSVEGFVSSPSTRALLANYNVHVPAAKANSVTKTMKQMGLKPPSTKVPPQTNALDLAYNNRPRKTLAASGNIESPEQILFGAPVAINDGLAASYNPPVGSPDNPVGFDNPVPLEQTAPVINQEPLAMAYNIQSQPLVPNSVQSLVPNAPSLFNQPHLKLDGILSTDLGLPQGNLFDV